MINIKIIDNEDLEKIKGGEAMTVWMGIAIATIVIFLSGVIEGITNPSSCKG